MNGKFTHFSSISSYMRCIGFRWQHLWVGGLCDELGEFAEQFEDCVDADTRDEVVAGDERQTVVLHRPRHFQAIPTAAQQAHINKSHQTRVNRTQHLMELQTGCIKIEPFASGTVWFGKLCF